MKGIALLVAGLVAGLAAGWFVTKSLWDEDARMRIEEYTALNDKYVELRSDAERTAPTTATSYDRHAIAHCMLEFTVRNSAIDAHLADKVMSDVEQGIFEPMLPVALNVRNKSYQARQSALLMEASRLDNECLDRAMIRQPN